MKGGIGQLMKQAQEMQANMKKAQEEMASLTSRFVAGLPASKMSCSNPRRPPSPRSSRCKVPRRLSPQTGRRLTGKN